MVAVTSVMRAHQILLARVENLAEALRPEFLALRVVTAAGVQPDRRAADHQGVGPAAGARHQRHTRDPPAGGPTGWWNAFPHPTDGRTTLVLITELGRSTVEDATITLNNEVFADIGMSDDESRSLADSIETLRRNFGRLLSSRGRRQRNGGRHSRSRTRARPDVEPAADDLGAFGHRQQAVAAHLVAAQRVLESVETHSVVDDFEAGGCRCRRRTSGAPCWHWRV